MDTLCVYFLYKSVENDTLNISLSCVDVLKNIEAVKEVIFAALCGDGLPPPSSSPWKGEDRWGSGAELR